MNEAAQNALKGAILCEDVARMQAALSSGADPNLPDANGETPLMAGIMCSNEAAVNCLLDAGAELNPSNPDLSPLDFARRFRNQPMIVLLQSRGALYAEPEPTPAEKDLYLAARTGKMPLLERALAAGADVNRVFDHTTALCHAIYRNQESMVRTLVEAGASAEIKDRDGTNLALRALDQISHLEHSKPMRALLKSLFPEVFIAMHRAPKYPAYDIDAILDHPGNDPLDWLHGTLRDHRGELRDHERLFRSSYEARLNIPRDGLSAWIHQLVDRSVLDEAARGLEAMQAGPAAQILRQALRVFPAGMAPDDEQSFQLCVRDLSPEQERRLEVLDAEFTLVDDDLDELARRWLEANRETFRQARA